MQSGLLPGRNSFIFLVLLLLMSNIHLFAQQVVINTITAKGRIIDSQTREAVPFTYIQVVGTSYGGVSDVNGNFTFKVNLKRFSVKLSCLGYKTETIQVDLSSSKSLEFKLVPETELLNEVVVKAGRKKYKNKGNPAYEIMEKAIANRSANNRDALDYYKNEKYEKLLLGFSDLTPEIKQKKALVKFQFVLENTDTTIFKGKEVLPVYLNESVTDCYFRKSPRSEKKIKKASDFVSFDKYFDDQGIENYVKHMYQDINIYNNDITFLTNQFLSPVATTAPLFYKYFISDTIEVDGDKCVEMFFSPRNKTDLLFQGYLDIMLDSSYAIRKVNMTVNKDINLNWVKDVNITQQFKKSGGHGWLLAFDDIKIDFGLAPKGVGIFGRKTVTYNNYAFDGGEIESVLQAKVQETHDCPINYNDEYWAIHRNPELAKSEEDTYSVIDSVQNVPVFKRTMEAATLLMFGYKDFGNFEIGPVNTFYSFNPIEGSRLRFGGRTTPQLSRKFNLDTYLAYGFKDEKYKYYVGTTWSLTPKTIYDFPVKYFKISYQNDTKIPGQDLRYIHDDNVLLSVKRGVNDKLFYNKTFAIEYLNEFDNHFSYTIGYQFINETPSGNLFFNYSDYTLHQNDDFSINVSEIYVNLRYAPHERFYQGKTYRTPIASKYPVTELQYTFGSRFLNSDYNYQRLHLTVSKRFTLSIIGYSDVVWEAGKIFGQVPYPLLAIHRANQSYSYQSLSYNMMNFLEFVSDQYISINIDHCFNGFFLNKVPLFKKLNLREIATFKILYGNVTNNNNPGYQNDLFKFPVDENGVPITFTLEKKPYIEASFGIGNIFRLFRVDVVRRFTYLDYPNVTKTGIRMRYKFDF
ncbi:MAG: DUF5686 and carboxypeptidase regulatory-like domain-containing protein [Bacteroidales bacterium]|nr:DUF5686 and carboxypeptidase regulatory-like domain-containing protein [Bacteroidales bacterium]